MSASNILSEKQLPKRRVLNPRAAVALGIIGVVLTVGVRKLHSYQFADTKQFLRTEAMQSLESGDFEQSHLLLNQYLSVQPSDMEAQEKLSILLVDHVGTLAARERAFRLNEDLLRDNIPQHGLRLRQARLALQLHRFSDAESHLKILQSAQTDSSEVWYLMGQVTEAMMRTAEAQKHYQRSIQCRSPFPQAFAALAAISDTIRGDIHAVEKLMNEMVERCPGADSWRIRATWLIEQNRLAEATDDLWRSLEPDADNLFSNVLLVQTLQQMDASELRLKPVLSEHLQRAIRHFQQLVRENPRQPLFVIDLAAVQWKAGQRKDAVTSLQSAIEVNPQTLILHRSLAEYLLSDQQVDLARQVIDQIPAEGLARGEREYFSGRLLMAEGKWDEAARLLDRCVVFCDANAEFLPGARMALAVALGRSTDSSTAVDAWRAVLAGNPQSVSGHLGLAAAWLKADQPVMAISEYRKLLDVPGVPAWLASQIIEYSLTRPRAVRDWNLVEQILSDAAPFVRDDVERALLQADLAFAQGEIVKAVNITEQALLDHPDRPELPRAVRRMNEELGPELQKRLQMLTDREPYNSEAHVALVRIYLSNADTAGADTWLRGIADKITYADSSEADRLRLIVRVLKQTQAREFRCHREKFQGWLQDQTAEYLLQLVELVPEQLPELVRQLSGQGRAAEAIRHIREADSSISPSVLALAFLEMARFSDDRSREAITAAEGIRELILQNPGDTELRVAYAEALLFAEQYSDAEATLRQVLAARPSHAAAKARVAWILVVTDGDRNEATVLADEAARQEPQDRHIRDCQYRVYLTGDRCSEILARQPGLHASDSDSSASLLIQTAAHLRLGRQTEARTLYEKLQLRLLQDPLLPADERLRESVRQELLPSSTAHR